MPRTRMERCGLCLQWGQRSGSGWERCGLCMQWGQCGQCRQCLQCLQCAVPAMTDRW